MLKLIKIITILIVFIHSNYILAGGEGLDNVVPIFEIVKWKSKTSVSDEDMIASVNTMVSDLKDLKGFLHQSLYKSTSGEWIDIYYWETEEDAHASNTSMADKASFKSLIELIEPESVSIEIFHPLQSSGQQSFEE